MHLVALAGLAISFALPTFAQQTNTPDPQLRQRLVEVIKKHGDAMNVIYVDQGVGHRTVERQEEAKHRTIMRPPPPPRASRRMRFM